MKAFILAAILASLSACTTTTALLPTKYKEAVNACVPRELQTQVVNCFHQKVLAPPEAAKQ